jgi:heat shock protein HslJ
LLPVKHYFYLKIQNKIIEKDKMKPTLVTFALILLLSSCMTNRKNVSASSEKVADIPPIATTPAVVPATTPQQLAGKKWVLKKMEGQTIKMDDTHEAPNAVFDLEKGSVNGFSGCNAYGGNCDITSKSIKISMIMATKKFCLDSPEADFFRCMEKCTQYKIVDNQLILSDAQGVLLCFE